MKLYFAPSPQPSSRGNVQLVAVSSIYGRARPDIQTFKR